MGRHGQDRCHKPQSFCSGHLNLICCAVLSILNYPDQRLHTIAKPVASVDARIQQIVADMAETMYEASGIGLAATQVDIHERIIVIDTSEERDALMVFINPELIWASPEKKSWREGCLSVPDF
ncbi:MAG: peptide deformylase [Burkholderiaceae bacterium]|nr:peptide deformylase [Burkholderiaceae bacterium]